MGSNGGGMATTRLSGTTADVDHRADTAAAALQFLNRTGNEDLISMLGLDVELGLSPRCKAPGCGLPFVPTATGGKQQTCSAKCGRALLAAERQADRNERNAKAKKNV
jgi:hypothetical protein